MFVKHKIEVTKCTKKILLKWPSQNAIKMQTNFVSLNNFLGPQSQMNAMPRSVENFVKMVVVFVMGMGTV